jgi:hypothetical protein
MAAMKHTITRTLTAVLLVVVAAGCSQHDDLLGEHTFIPAPTPTDVIVTDNNDGTYDINWTVGDDSAVKNYRVYSLSAFSSPEVIGEPTDTVFGIDLFIPVGGVVLGVTAVTVENVEGAMTVVVTPEPGGGP